MYVSVGNLTASQSLALTLVLRAIQLIAVYAVAFLVDRVGRRPPPLTAFERAAWAAFWCNSASTPAPG